MTDNNSIGKDTVIQYTAKDFASSQVVKWCPGCGDFSILAHVQKLFAKLGIPKENFVWVSGIGCSSRFPYYVDTYGFHGIHGRATAIATGVKVANPKLSVWVATGDGDLLSIGGNHFIHACRRNVDFKIILFNNKIYGLTKGQYSPTSPQGKKTKSSPFGSVDYPFEPSSVALGAGASFIARVIDKEQKLMAEVLDKAAYHTGTAFIEVLLRCAIFSDDTYQSMTDKETKSDSLLVLQDGNPMVFGTDDSKGIKLDGLNPVIVNLNDGTHSVNDLWVHNEKDPNPAAASILASLSEREGFPTPVGVFRSIIKPSYDFQVEEQIEKFRSGENRVSLDEVLGRANTWEVS